MMPMKGPSDSVSETAGAQQRVSVTLASGHHRPRSCSSSSDAHPHPPTHTHTHAHTAGSQSRGLPLPPQCPVSGTAGAPSVLPGIASSLCES